MIEKEKIEQGVVNMLLTLTLNPLKTPINQQIEK